MKMIYKKGYRPLRTDLNEGEIIANIPDRKLFTKDKQGNVVTFGLTEEDLEEAGVFLVGYEIRVEATAATCDPDWNPYLTEIGFNVFEVYNGGERAPLTKVPQNMKIVVTNGTINGGTTQVAGETIASSVDVTGVKTPTIPTGIELLSSNGSQSYAYAVISYVADGADGAEGIQGIPGEPGEDGVTYYTWVKYADDASGTGMSDYPDGKAYLGISYNNITATESTDPADYSWSLIQGEQGIQGPPGADGQTTYTWIKYAYDNTGTGLSDDPTGRLYIGIAVNKTTATESTDPADYTWALIKGDKGDKGDTGAEGVRGQVKVLVDVYNASYTKTITTSATTAITKWRYRGQTIWNTVTSSTDTFSDLTSYLLPFGVYKQRSGDEFHFDLYDSESADAPICSRYARCKGTSTSYNASQWDFGAVLYLDGSMMIEGTVYADALDAEAISGQRIEIDPTTNPTTSGGYIAEFRDNTSGPSVYMGNTNSAGTCLLISSAGLGLQSDAYSTGILGTTATGAGVEGRTSNASNLYGLFTPDKTYSGAGYSPFTGSHVCFTKDISMQVGDIASIQHANVHDVDNALIFVESTADEKDKAVIGVVSVPPTIGQEFIDKIDISSKVVGTRKEKRKILRTYRMGGKLRKVEEDMEVDVEVRAIRDEVKGFKAVTINALGEGAINVCSANGNIEAGDYICSSHVPGKGMKQDDDLLHSYTVAKALESVDWSKEESSVKMIACTYHCG